MHRDRQPFLDDQVIVLRAPTQFWSDRSGDAGHAADPRAAAIHGLYHGDVRVLHEVMLTADGERPEWLSVARDGASVTTFTGVLRHLDGPGADPRVRIDRTRETQADALIERIVITSARDVAVRTTIGVDLRPDFAPMQDVKAGIRRSYEWASQQTGDGVVWTSGPTTATLRATDAAPRASEAGAVVEWNVELPPNGSATLEWRVELTDASPVVAGAPGAPAWRDLTVASGDSRLARWVTTALSDLDALRMTSKLALDEEFLAAGAPWFFTLFGRDSLWAARFLLPVSTAPALSTLRVLAAAQGTRVDPQTAEQPGKIMHELRAAELDLPDEGVTLPPLYFGTIDATPLWVCLLHDAWKWGAGEADIRSLLPNLEAALGWMRDYGDSDHDGFLEYVDTTGHGLANQGWKDSGDSIQWRDGTLAEYVAMEARNLAPLPGDVDFTVGASLPISGLTAWQGLFQHGRLQAGQSVLAHGAAGAVGSMVTQLAREAGAYVIGTGRAADRQKALDFGANEFVDLETNALKDIGGVDLVFDVIGGDIQKRSAALVRAGGTLVTVVGPAEARPADGLAIDFVVESDRAQLSEIVQRVRDGRLRTNIGIVATLDDAVAAFNSKERHAGKTVIRVRP